MQTKLESLDSRRIGFHYFPDTKHYTNHDLEQYLPILEKLRASWLILLSESTRAIPEQFITTLVAHDINPIIHLPLQLPDCPTAADLKAILQAYASWGAKYIILFDHPNSHDSWLNSGWSQANLVESFLDRFIPLANECLNLGVEVVFPPLEPGGNYWDLSFLHNCLVSLQRRNQKNLLNHLHLSAYSRGYGRSLDWGKGGFERWSGNKPYSTPSDSQDQIGFRNFEWVQETAQAVCNRPFKLILLGAGQTAADPSQNLSFSEQKAVVYAVNDLLSPVGDAGAEVDNIIAANFWLFSADENDPSYPSAWIKSDGTFAPVAELLQKTAQKSAPEPASIEPMKSSPKEQTPTVFPIQHYLLLPAYEWGVADWHLDVIKPFVRKHQPTIGFSLKEASLAVKVTVIGGEQSFSEDSLIELRNLGCQVERISGDGTSIATQLSER